MPQTAAPDVELAGLGELQPQHQAGCRRWAAKYPLLARVVHSVSSAVQSSSADTGRGVVVDRSSTGGTPLRHTQSSSASPPQSSFSGSGRAWEGCFFEGSSGIHNRSGDRESCEVGGRPSSSSRMARKAVCIGLASCLLIAAVVAGSLAASASARRLKSSSSSGEDVEAVRLVGGADAATADLSSGEVRAMAAKATSELETAQQQYSYDYFPGLGCTTDTLKRFQGVPSEEECRALCDMDSGCGAYTYSTSGNDKCYLKQDCSATKDKASNNSGVKGDLLRSGDNEASAADEEEEEEKAGASSSTTAKDDLQHDSNADDVDLDANGGGDEAAVADDAETPSTEEQAATVSEEASDPSVEGGPYGADFVMYDNVACFLDSSVPFFSVQLTGGYAYPWLCRRYCASHPSCKAFTFSSDTSFCYYLRSCDKREIVMGATSGVDASIDNGFDLTTTTEDTESSRDDEDSDTEEEQESSTEDVDESESQDGSALYNVLTDVECVVDDDALDVQSDVSTVEACQAACDALSGCNGYTYNPDTDRCYLVEDCTETSSEGGNTSGIRKSTPSPTTDAGEDDSPSSVSTPTTAPVVSNSDDNDNDDDDDDNDGNPADSPIPSSDHSGSAEEEEEEEEAGRSQSDSSAVDSTEVATEKPTAASESEISTPTDTHDEGDAEMPQTYVSPIEYGVVDTSRYNLYLRTGCQGDSIEANSGFSTVAECQAWCDEHDDCQAFTLNFKRGRCYLKRDCEDRKVEEDDVSGAKKAIDNCDVSSSCEDGDPDTVCPRVTALTGEMDDPVPGTFEPPYWNVTYVPTYDKHREYPMCDWKPPRDPLPRDWVEQCIENARGVGFLAEEKGRPNEECPAGWFLCKGMCYTLSQRNNRGPQRDSDYYSDDFMFVESRCGLCGGARVAFVGDDPDMQRVAAEAARQTINEDKATWVRRFRFLPKRNPLVQNGTPYQPWHLFVAMFDDDKRVATYQRYYTGEKDDLAEPGWDKRFRNQEASILCVNTIPRIREAIKHSRESRITMEGGCEGDDKDNMWDNHDHRWRPEQSNYPFPGH